MLDEALAIARERRLMRSHTMMPMITSTSTTATTSPAIAPACVLCEDDEDDEVEVPVGDATPEVNVDCWAFAVESGAGHWSLVR